MKKEKWIPEPGEWVEVRSQKFVVDGQNCHGMVGRVLSVSERGKGFWKITVEYPGKLTKDGYPLAYGWPLFALKKASGISRLKAITDG